MAITGGARGFLRIPGLTPVSPTHAGEVEVHSYRLETRFEGALKVTDLVLTRSVDLLAPRLIEAAARSIVFKNVDLVVARVVGASALLDVQEYRMQDVRVRRVTHGGTAFGSVLPSETVEMRFGRLNLIVRTFNNSGQVTSQVNLALR